MSIVAIFFTVNIIIFLFFSLLTFAATCSSEGDNKLYARLRNIAKPVCIACVAVLALMLILDIAGVVSMSGYRFISLLVMLNAAIYAAAAVVKADWEHRPLFNFAMRSLTVIFALELFVFNLNSAHLLGGDYPEKTLDINSAQTVNYNIETGKNNDSGETQIEFKGLETPVGTITVYASSDKKSRIDISIDMTDETFSAYYRGDIARINAINGNERSMTSPMNFSGTVHDLRIRYYADTNETITVTRIAINQPIRFHFSFVRFLIFFIGSIIAYMLASPQYLRRPYEERRKAVRLISYAFTAVLIFTALTITNMYRYLNPEHSIINDLNALSGNQISQEIVDAFEDKRIYLSDDVNEDLAALENPYDGSQREAGGVGGYPWDHLLFEGKYYSYYGIGPVLTLFLPYHLLSGCYFPSVWATWLYGVLGIWFLTKMWLKFANKFFRKTYASLILMGLMIIQLSTGIFFCFYNAAFYEIAQASGFFCVTAGAYYLLCSNVIGGGKIRNGALAASGIYLAFGVLCRPTLAVYCLAAMLFVYAGFKKKKSMYETGSKARYYAPYFLCALLPYVLIGSIQVWYNYARFGSPFDFGIQYSLTINDFTHAQYHTHFALIGFFNYLLALPSFTPYFPFMQADHPQTFDPQGYYFIATGAALGLLWRALPILSYSRGVRAYRMSENRNKRLYLLLVLAVCIACPFAVIFSIWESGYGTRYCVDFAWQMILGALIICYIIHERCKENTRKHLNSLMIFSVIVSLYMNFIQIYSYIDPTTMSSTEWQESAIAFARLFEFWK